MDLNLIEQFVRMLPAEAPTLMAELPDGMRVFFPMKDWAIGWQIALHNYETATRNTIQRLLKPGMACIDLGANLGYYPLVMARSGARKVYAFEPFPSAFALLSRNVSENRLTHSVVCIPRAADEKCGRSRIYYALDNGGNFGGMFVPNRDDSEIARAHASVEIETVRVDDVIPAGERIGLVKIDVEGAECRALHGMERILERDRPNLIIEFNTACLRRMAETDPNQLLQQIAGYNYSIADENGHPFSYAGGDIVANIVATPTAR